jgi:hypothetical protein
MLKFTYLDVVRHFLCTSNDREKLPEVQNFQIPSEKFVNSHNFLVASGDQAIVFFDLWSGQCKFELV